MPSVVNELDGGMPVKHLLDIYLALKSSKVMIIQHILTISMRHRTNQIMKERLSFLFTIYLSWYTETPICELIYKKICGA